jgi:hypothetical protein
MEYSVATERNPRSDGTYEMVESVGTVDWMPSTGALLGTSVTSGGGSSGSPVYMGTGTGAEVVGIHMGFAYMSDGHYYQVGARASQFRDWAINIMD